MANKRYHLIWVSEGVLHSSNYASEINCLDDAEHLAKSPGIGFLTNGSGDKVIIHGERISWDLVKKAVFIGRNSKKAEK